VRTHHRAAIERLEDRFAQEPDFPALIVGGSIVKGIARPDSDVDVYLVATDERFERCRQERDHFFISGDFTDYEGGYVDGKIISLKFLHDVADRGSEPARWAFVGAQIVYSRILEVEELVRRIVVFPKEQRRDKIESFFSQVRVLRWFIDEAEKRNDRYLLLRSAADMALFAGRLALIDNEIFFPSHKWFMREVRQATRKPDPLCDLMDAVLQNPCAETAAQLEQCVIAHYDPGLTWTQILTRFMADSEWNWLSGGPPIQDS
jgi:predicted nucleotidyltransferase